MMSNPKVYSDAYQLSIHAFNHTRTFPKFHRPTLGRRMEETTLDLTIRLRFALMASKSERALRQEHLEVASHCLDELRIVLQLCLDLRLLRPAAYNEMCVLTAEIGKEVGGLKKFETRRPTDGNEAKSHPSPIQADTSAPKTPS